MLPAERRRFLAGVGRRLTGQALARRDPERRYPILLALLAESAVDVLDEVVLLFDQALSGRESAARTRLREVLAERARDGEDRQVLLDEILAVILDLDIAGDQSGRCCGRASGWNACAAHGPPARSACRGITGIWRCWTRR
jgi:hypothetical protein